MASNTASFTVEIPKNTSSILRIFEVLDSRVSNVHIVIPPGHKGLAGITVSTPGAQIAPAPGSLDQFIRGDGQEVDFNPDLIIDGPPYQIIVKGYNADSFLAHSFIVRVTTERR